MVLNLELVFQFKTKEGELDTFIAFHKMRNWFFKYNFGEHLLCTMIKILLWLDDLRSSSLFHKLWFLPAP